MAAGGSIGACGGGDALPTRPVQVHIGVGVTCYVFHVPCLQTFLCIFRAFSSPEEKSHCFCQLGGGKISTCCAVLTSILFPVVFFHLSSLYFDLFLTVFRCCPCLFFET